MGKEWASKQAPKKRKKNKNKSEQDKINRKKSQRKVQKNPYRPRDTYIHTQGNPIKTQRQKPQYVGKRPASL